MAISVKDIQEKIFANQVSGGYNVEEVDDFLDEITDQLSALIRENLALKGQVNKLEEDLEAKEASLQEAIKKTPDYNEEGYFRNLQSAMRDSLIGAQRIADEAKAAAQSEAERILADAKAEAQATVEDAQANASRITAEAQANAAAANEEYATLKAAAEKYRADFRKVVEDQLNVIKANDLLFK